MMHISPRGAARQGRPASWWLLVAFSLAWATSPATARSSNPRVWTESSLTRIGETDAPGPSTSVEVWAARGEYESFQIAVRPSSLPLTNVNVTMSDLSGPGGAWIPRSAFTLYREHYVTVAQASPDKWGPNRPLGAGRYADALIPFLDPETGRPPAGAALRAVPFSVASDINQPVWVDVQVPSSAVAGPYTATFTVTSDQGVAVGHVTLHVWNFALPHTPTLKSAFSFGNGASGTPAENRELLRHRLSPISVSASDERVLIDAHGLTARALGFWSDANRANCEAMEPAPSSAEVRARVALHQPDLYLYNYTADEIGACPALFPRLREWARALHSAGVPNLVTIAPTPELLDDGSGSGRSAVDIWAMVPWLYDARAAEVALALGKGDQVWSYNALSQDDYSPKWQMDYPPINFRIQPGFISQSLHLAGMLYWKVDRWSKDPWNDVDNTGIFAPGHNYPGEGMLVYPGSEAGLVGAAPSMRLKWLRDGVDDYDYVALLRARGRGAWAEQVARQVGPDWKNWTRDPAAVERARWTLGMALDQVDDDSPRNLAVSVSGSSAAFSWLPPATGGEPLGYTLLAAMSPGGVPIGSLNLWPTTGTTIHDIPAGRYYVWLTATNARGTGAPSNEVTVTVAGMAAPASPTLDPAVQSGSLVTLTWRPGSGSPPSHYVIAAAYDSAGPIAGSLAVSGSSITVSAPSGAFYVWITGVNAAGAGPASNQIRVIVP